MGVRIVWASKKDPAILTELADIDVKAGYLPSEQFDYPDEWKKFSKLFDFFFVVDGDGETIGSIHLGANLRWGNTETPVKCDGCLYVGSIAILPDYRQNGAGTAAVEWIIETAKANMFSCIIANVHATNIASSNLFRSADFELYKIIKNYWHEPDDEDCLVFRLKL